MRADKADRRYVRTYEYEGDEDLSHYDNRHGGAWFVVLAIFCLTLSAAAYILAGYLLVTRVQVQVLPFQ